MYYYRDISMFVDYAKKEPTSKVILDEVNFTKKLNSLFPELDKRNEFKSKGKLWVVWVSNYSTWENKWSGSPLKFFFISNKLPNKILLIDEYNGFIQRTLFELNDSPLFGLRKKWFDPSRSDKE